MIDERIVHVDDRLKFVLIKTTDMDSARQIADEFLKTIETTESEFKASRFSMHKKDNSLIKVEYFEYLKKPLPKPWRYKKYNIKIIDRVKKEVVFDASGIFEDIEKDMPISSAVEWEIAYNMSSDYLKFTYYEEFDIGEYCDYHVEVKAL